MTVVMTRTTLTRNFRRRCTIDSYHGDGAGVSGDEINGEVEARYDVDDGPKYR